MVCQINDEIIFRDFDLLHVLIVEMGLHEGFLMVRVSYGLLIDGKDLQWASKYVIEVEDVAILRGLVFDQPLVVVIALPHVLLFIQSAYRHPYFFSIV